MSSLNVVVNAVKSIIVNAVVSTSNTVLNTIETVAREVRSAYNSEHSTVDHLKGRSFEIIKDHVKESLFYGCDEQEIMLLKFLNSIVDLTLYIDITTAQLAQDPDSARDAYIDKDLEKRVQINEIVVVARQELDEERNERVALFHEERNELPLIKDVMGVVGRFIY